MGKLSCRDLKGNCDHEAGQDWGWSLAQPWSKCSLTILGSFMDSGEFHFPCCIILPGVWSSALPVSPTIEMLVLVPSHSVLSHNVLEQSMNSTMTIKVVKLPNFLFVGMVSRSIKDEFWIPSRCCAWLQNSHLILTTILCGRWIIILLLQKRKLSLGENKEFGQDTPTGRIAGISYSDEQALVSLNPLDWGHLLLAFVFCCWCVLFCFCSVRNGIHGLMHA
jgi:hypothetical protein